MAMTIFYKCSLCVFLGGAMVVVTAIGSTSQSPKVGRDSISLTAAERFHERLNEKCSDCWAAAQYLGSLSRLPVAQGLTPAGSTGQWRVVPRNALTPQVDRQGRLTKLLGKEDILFELTVTPPAGKTVEPIALTVDGETVVVFVDGVPKDWRLPETSTTVNDLLQSCSDR